MKKKAILALLLALTLLLTGCSLIKKDAAVDAATEIIRLGDRVVTKAEVVEQVNSQLSQQAYMYSMYGYSFDPTDPSVVQAARESVVEDFKKDIVIRNKIAGLGFDKLTEEEEAQVKADAEEEYNSELDYVKSYYLTDDGTEKTDEEKTAEAASFMEAQGLSMEYFLTGAREKLTESKLKDEIIKDVAVTDEDIQTEYDSKVASAKETYAENASSYCSAVNNGSTVYYAPAGVRLVKQILIKFTDEDQALVDAANKKISDANAVLNNEEATEEEKAQAQTDLDAATAELDAATKTAYANIDEKADAVIAEVTGGADWDEVMERETQDPGMKQGRATAETGYAVCENMSSFDPAFTAAAMALEKIGDISAKTSGSSNGYYIIKYVGDVAEGGIDIAKVKDTLSASLLTTKQNDLYDRTIEDWVGAEKFKVDMGALKD